ncbi:hypothetical protein SISSUDRAFT_1068125 [Sistotremastrum suecicum HHB10207 ss-3]|uniref:Uncharacterized protein n=1 Tax=Sistotremastrum suecicum HHB10207 ss-3 TaxID=1314776 RepID=A0A165WF66_9AGAM|nr:hypothetical protein SISSUDRAFT_1068125 [Sistotremastrum suecicum HHB10207 ss-3]
MLVEAWKVGLWAIICEVTEVNNSREASSRTACHGESAALSHSEEPPHSDQPLFGGPANGSHPPPPAALRFSAS